MEIVLRLAQVCPEFRWLTEYSCSSSEEEDSKFEKVAKDIITQMAQSTKEAREGVRFLEVVSQLIGSGSVQIGLGKAAKPDERLTKTFIGWKNNGLFYLIPDVTIKEVKKVIDLRITKNALYQQLDEMGVVEKSNSKTTKWERFGNEKQRVLCILEKFINE